MRGAATEADLGDHLVGFQQRHVFQEQADHALALTLRRGRIVPQAGEVFHQRHHLPTLVRTERAAGGGTLTALSLPGCGEGARLWVLLRLPRICHPGVCRVEPEAAAAWTRR